MAKKVHIPLPIQWHEGLLLYPQHFQQQRRVIQDTLTAGLAAAHPFFWGVFSYSVDPKALKAGVLHVDNLQAIMPDGLPVAVTPDTPLRLSLEDAEKKLAQQAQTVHLCLPLEHAGSANARDPLPRYREVCETEHHHPDEKDSNPRQGPHNRRQPDQLCVNLFTAGAGAAILPELDQTHHKDGGKDGDGDNYIAAHWFRPSRGVCRKTGSASIQYFTTR